MAGSISTDREVGEAPKGPPVPFSSMAENELGRLTTLELRLTLHRAQLENQRFRRISPAQRQTAPVLLAVPREE